MLRHFALLVSCALTAFPALSQSSCNRINEDFSGLAGTVVGTLPGWSGAGLIPPFIDGADRISMTSEVVTRASRDIAGSSTRPFRLTCELTVFGEGYFHFDGPFTTSGPRRAVLVLFDVASGANVVTSGVSGAQLPIANGSPFEFALDVDPQGMVRVAIDGIILDEYPFAASTQGATPFDEVVSFTFFTNAVGFGIDGFAIDDVCLSNRVGTSYCPAAANSTGAPSVLFGRGTNSLLLNGVTLRSEGLPAGVFGYYLASFGSGFVANPGGSSGNLCLAGPGLGRYLVSLAASNGNGVLEYPLVPAAPDAFPGGGPIPSGPFVAGQTAYFQLWHRDVVGGVPTSNFSPGLEVTFRP